MKTTEERLAVLETKLAATEETLSRMADKVDAMHEILLQAKGARWAILAMATVGGAFAGWAHKFIPFLRS